MKNKHNKDQAVNDDETKTIQTMEEETLKNLETKIGKLFKHQPPLAIAFHEFRIKYKLPREGVNPHKIINKVIDEAKIKEVFGAAKGRSGFSFVYDEYRFHGLAWLKQVRLDKIPNPYDLDKLAFYLGYIDNPRPLGFRAFFGLPNHPTPRGLLLTNYTCWDFWAHPSSVATQAILQASMLCLEGEQKPFQDDNLIVLSWLP